MVGACGPQKTGKNVRTRLTKYKAGAKKSPTLFRMGLKNESLD
jgi:hypothetical protein